MEALAAAPARWFRRKCHLVQTKPLFFATLIFIARRGGSDVSFSKPSHPSWKTPRFSAGEFCAQARGSRGVRFIGLAPVREIKRPETEGSGLSVCAQAQRLLKVLLGIRLWSLLACFWPVCWSLWNRVVSVGGLRAPFGRLRGSLGAVLGALWPLGGRLLAPFGSLWASPVAARSPLGRLWALLGPLWASPVAARALVGRLLVPAGQL